MENNMNEVEICQSCAIELSPDILGTNIDGSYSSHYCMYCFQDGNFTENLTLNDAIIKIATQAEANGVSKEDAIRFVSKNLPNLKRWKQ